MSIKSSMKVVGVSGVALAGLVLASGPALAGCTHPYVPVKHSSGNTVCIHQAVVNAPQDLAAPKPHDPTAQIPKFKKGKLKAKRIRRNR